MSGNSSLPNRPGKPVRAHEIVRPIIRSIAYSASLYGFYPRLFNVRGGVGEPLGFNGVG
jgi:hypothetical protein